MTAPVKVGDVIAGKYEVERIMAAGAMGVIVAARHRTLEQRVALKFMLASEGSEAVPPEMRERFLREGQAAVRLRGENVARTLDVDTLDDGTPYLVMEYLEGMSLGEHLAKHRPLPLAESVDYVLQACVAMAEAHRAGIIHRDLKPDNLFLTRRPDGSPLVKVLDFGISKVHAGPQQEGSSTQTSMIMGSPSYMPPEQIRSSREVDARSDIWALGVILYECTSGQRPFQHAADTSVAALMAQVLYEDARPWPARPPTCRKRSARWWTSACARHRTRATRAWASWPRPCCRSPPRPVGPRPPRCMPSSAVRPSQPARCRAGRTPATQRPNEGRARSYRRWWDMIPATHRRCRSRLPARARARPRA